MIDLLTTPLVHPVAALTVWATDPTPQPADVKAGWTAFVIFLLLGLAVVLLGISLVKQLKKAQAAKDAGIYGDEPKADGGPGEPVDPDAPVAPADQSDHHDQRSS